MNTIRLTENDLHNIVRKTLSRIEEEKWKSPLQKTKENGKKNWEEINKNKIKVTRSKLPTKKPTIGDKFKDLDKLKETLPENYIRRIVKESVNKLLKESYGDPIPFRVLNRYLKSIGFQCTDEGDFSRPDMPLTYEKVIWPDEGQTYVELTVYPMGNGKKEIYSVVVDYDLCDDAAFNRFTSGDNASDEIQDLEELKEYLHENGLDSWY